VLSTDLQLALSPVATYRALIDERSTSSWWMVAVHPAFFALLFGALVSITATGHITIALLFHISLSWSFLVVWQAIAAAVIILPATARGVSRARAFELLFLAHVPWSLSLLAMATIIPVAPIVPIPIVVLALMVPIAWTAVIISAFCQTILGATRRVARQLTLVHQLVIWGATLFYLWFAVGGWVPILQQVGL